MARYAEEANYWTTTVHPAKSQGEISEMLDDFGATAVFTMTGQVNGKYAWLIRFQWQGRQYRFTFIPLTCADPNKSFSFPDRKRRTADEQARYQMGRIAVNFVKAILTAAEATPAALFGFIELPIKNDQGLLATTAELDIEGLTSALPALTLKALGTGQ